jgi:hypothetical protein
MSHVHVRARVSIAGIAVVALVLATAAGFPAKTNPKDLAVAKAAVLRQADVPSGFTQVAAKITKEKPSGIKACKKNEATNKIAKSKWKSAFDATDNSSIQSTVDVFTSRAAMKKALAIIGSDSTITCLKQGLQKQLAKNKGLTATVDVVQQPISVGDVSTGFVATIVLSAGGQSQTVTSYAGFVGSGRAATQMIYTDQSGTFDATIPQQLMQSAATNLETAQP